MPKYITENLRVRLINLANFPNQLYLIGYDYSAANQFRKALIGLRSKFIAWLFPREFMSLNWCMWINYCGYFFRTTFWTRPRKIWLNWRTPSILSSMGLPREYSNFQMCFGKWIWVYSRWCCDCELSNRLVLRFFTMVIKTTQYRMITKTRFIFHILYYIQNNIYFSFILTWFTNSVFFLF